MSEASDPWRLSPQQMATLDAYVRHGCAKRAADALCISVKTLSCHTSRAREKMNCRTLLLALVQWDRYRRGDKDCKWGVTI